VALPAIPTFDADATGRSLGARSDKRRVALVACADSSTQKSAARWLTSTGFEVVTAVAAAEALDQFGRHRPVIVLTDMTLRNERGRSLCEVLGHQSPWSRVPILALCSGTREAKAALEAGATDLLQRPFDWHVGSVRAERLVRLAETTSELDGMRAEMDRLRKSAEEERQERGGRDHFDALTGLPDGERLERALENALVTASETSQVAVALFDIEHLVVVNSRLGRARANSVLQQVAQRLISGLRSEEVLRSAAGPSMSSSIASPAATSRTTRRSSSRRAWAWPSLPPTASPRKR
jgi:PleD family two-component response regulator